MHLSVPLIFLAGMATFLTPCVLPLIPIYVGSLAGSTIEEAEESLAGRWRMLKGALTFVLGFTVIFVALGSASSLVGKAMVSYRHVLTQVGGLVVFLFGLKMLKMLNIGILDREFRVGMNTGTGFWGNLLFGMVFALGWTPCIGPVLGSVLTYTAGTTSDPIKGGLYLLAYAVGFAVPLLAVALFLSAANTVMDKLKRHMHKVEVVGGASLVIVGLMLLFGNISLGGGGGKAVACTPAGKASVLEFKSASCTVCKAMDPVVDHLKHDCRGHQVAIKQVVIEEGNNRALAKKYRIIGYPTFIFLNNKGEVVARLVGKQRLHVLHQHLTLLTGQTCPAVGRAGDGGAGGGGGSSGDGSASGSAGSSASSSAPHFGNSGESGSGAGDGAGTCGGDGVGAYCTGH
ncbi:MAG: hypothetical protein J7M25_16760 [Deltaproteobacteria bacterium]|nr:hypothetical protein [Deltaproteobacteria bacterium]